MSGRLCCYRQQRHSKLYLLSLCSKCPPFALTHPWRRVHHLTDCRINNALIQFIPSCQDTRTQFIDVLGLPFSDIACSIISCLVVGIFMQKNNIITNFCHLALGGRVIMPHRVLVVVVAVVVVIVVVILAD